MQGVDLEAARQREQDLEKHNQGLQLRVDALIRDLDLSHREVVELRGVAPWELAQEHRALGQSYAAVAGQLQTFEERQEAALAELRGRLVHKEAELLAAQHEAAAQRRHSAEVEEALRESERRCKALEVRGYDQYEQLTRAQSTTAAWEAKARRWSKERASLQRSW